MQEKITPRFVLIKILAELRRVSRKIARRFVRKSVTLFRRVTNPVLHFYFSSMLSKTRAGRGFKQGQDSFVFYRIIGNDLPPRHRELQSIENLILQIENEAALKECEKWWIVNRIFDKDAFEKVINVLDEHGCNYFVIPFDEAEYRSVKLDESVGELIRNHQPAYPEKTDERQVQRAAIAQLRLKNLYVMNNNGARNAAIAHGRERAKWVLPWDGNCFVTEAGWELIRQGVLRKNHLPYHIVPMTRATDNSAVLHPDFCPNPVEEPQMIFYRDSRLVFDERMPYGRRPKVDLLRRLGVWGPWMRWSHDLWDQPVIKDTIDKWLYAVSKGWVVRLSSGNPEQEAGGEAAVNRLNQRNQAIIETIRGLDDRCNSDHIPDGGNYDKIAE